MPSPLRLTLTDYLDATQWRWVLSDHKGGFLADHTVRLNPSTREYRGFLDLAEYLDFYREAYPPERQLAELGDWIGEQVFGGLRAKLWQQRSLPAQPVQVFVPKEAQELLFRPFELARFDDGHSFRAAGIRFVYQRDGVEAPARDKQPAAGSLRILAVFSLPVSQNPLNLRRERYELQRLMRRLNQTRGRAVELRVLQYGATRDTLRKALQEGQRWDIVQLSGHGGQGELLLEDDRGGTDTIGAEELGALLAPATERLKLLILDACYSGAGSHAAARVQLGLDRVPLRQTGAEGEAVAETSPTVLPSLAQTLAERLDCAALAMRYPVGDAFATELMLSLYGKLLEQDQPLPAALHLALDEALESNIPIPPLSPATPILLGGRGRAADLQLVPPQRPLGAFTLPTTGLGIAFPEEPERFVGRLQPMLRASQALATHSAERGVLFYGMPGGGKTACALELAYRHAESRFLGHVWYQAPEAGSDIATALFGLLFEIERQLNAPGMGLTTALDDPQRFRQYTLPRLRTLLQQHSLLLVLDNLESLLTDSGGWRDPLWGEVLAALLGHNGPSRLVLTSRRVPADLEKHPRLQQEAIHALSLAESLLLARELQNLNSLFGDETGLDLLRQTLRSVQGHPKLLELADGLAADRGKLAQRVAAAEAESAGQGEVLDAFFATGLPQEGETRRSDADFVRELQGWTAGVAAGLPPTAGLLFQVLCCLEPVDRRQHIIEITWKPILTRLGDGHPQAQAALAEPDLGLPAALQALARAGLAGVEPPPELDASQRAALEAHLSKHPSPPTIEEFLSQYRTQYTAYTVHPAVAEAARAAADPVLTAATEIELGNYFIAMFRHGLETEQEGGGGTVVDAARRAAPYLLRRERWGEAANLLENMLCRDASPEALAYALPLLRRIAGTTRGTERELMSAGLLARTLRQAGRNDEAEPLLRELIERSSTRGEFRTTSSAAGELLDLLRDSGRLVEALKLAEEMAGYTRAALLGPWTQLSDERQRLDVLAALGRHDEVLAAVEGLRPKMGALPEQSKVEEATDPWNVREGLLATGRNAAIYSRRYEQALALNAEIVKAKAARGATALELARTRFNDNGPLLRLQHYQDASHLLLDCREVFEAERAIPELGRVYSALATLENETGGRAEAVRFEEIALGYSYQAGTPEDCAGSHNNLAGHLQRRGEDSTAVVAHSLAAASIALQMHSGHLPSLVRNLAINELPAEPPSFDTVADTVEQIKGVRFRELFERLPRTAPDGDGAIAAIWRLVVEERQRQSADEVFLEAAPAEMPPVLSIRAPAARSAFDLDVEAFSTALRSRNDPPLVDPEPKTMGYTVWYGTNRRPVNPDDHRAGFLGVRETDPTTIHYGNCDVSIPKSHQFGSVGSPWWKRWLSLTDDRLKLRKIDPASESDFWRSIKEEFAKWDEQERQALVYLHGFNVSFEEAAIRAAQIGFDLKVPGVTAFFSWPSRGTVQSYPADAASIEASEAAITEFLVELASDVGAERLHIVAHSMGNRGLLRAMQRIQADVQRRSQVKFGQIFLAAPDVDVDLFRQLAVAYPQLSRRTTLYVSPGDKAVGLSEWLHDAPRAGFTPPVTVVPGIDTVEIPDFNLDALGHSYYAEAAGVLHDMFDLLCRNASPLERQRLLEARLANGIPYWTMQR